MAEAKLSGLYSALISNSPLYTEVQAAVDRVEEDLKSRIMFGLFSLTPQRSLGSFIKKAQERASEVEAAIREARIRDAEKKKVELMHKLQAVEDSLSLLNTEQSPPPVEKPKALNLQDRRIRHQFMEEETAKANEAAEFAKKLHHEQLIRKRRQMEREHELSKHVFAEIKGYDAIKQRYDTIINGEKQRKRDLMLGRAEARKAEMERRRIAEMEYKSSMSPMPKFKQLEEQYRAQRFSNGLALKKQELAAKRSVLVQPSVQSLSPKGEIYKYGQMPKVSSSLNFKTEHSQQHFKEKPRALKRLAVFHADAGSSLPVRTKQSVAAGRDSRNPFEAHLGQGNIHHFETVNLTDSSRNSVTDFRPSLRPQKAFMTDKEGGSKGNSKNTSKLYNTDDSLAEF
jgi:hypothetical protein